MSQSTRSGSKLAQRQDTDAREVEDALLDHSAGSTSGISEQIDAAEDVSRP